jgi:uncharacterized membrane protein
MRRRHDRLDGLAIRLAPRCTNALDLLERLRKEDLLQLDDAAIVTWPEDRKKPKTEQLRAMSGIGVLGGGFWVCFRITVSYAASGNCRRCGDWALKDVREKVTPGTSALFLMTSNVVQDKVFDQFRSTDAQLVSTNLSVEQEQRLREVFGEE